MGRRHRSSASVVALLAVAIQVAPWGQAPALAAACDPGITTVTWDGGAGTASWHNPANWDADRVPGAGDHVCIDTPGALVVYSSGTTSIETFEVRGTAALRIDAGTLTIASDSQATSFEQTSGTLTGAGNLTVTGTLSFAGTSFNSTQSGTGTTTVASGATLSITGRPIFQGGRSLVVAAGATGTWSDAATNSSITVQSPSEIRIEGSLEIAHAGNRSTSGSGVIRVAAGGSVTKTGAGTTAIGASNPFGNDGSVTIHEGVLALNAGDGGTTTGTYQLDAGTSLRPLLGTFTLATPASIAGDGTLDVRGFADFVVGADVNVDVPLLVLAESAEFILQEDVTVPRVMQTGASIVGPGNLTVTERYEILPAGVSAFNRDGGATTVATGAELTVASSIAVQGGRHLVLAPGATGTWTAGNVNIASPSELLVEGDLSIEENATSTSGGGTLRVAAGGTVTKLNAVTTDIPTVVNHGTFDVQAGVVEHLTSTLVFQNNGLFRLDSDAATLFLDFVQSDTGTFATRIGGATPGTGFGHLEATFPTSEIALAGTLQVRTAPGFVPAVGQSFAVVNGTEVAGDFATVDAPGYTSVANQGTPGSVVVTALNEVFVDGDLVVTDCADPDLARIVSVSGDVTINAVAGCDTIALAGLVSVGGDVTIVDNGAGVIELGGLEEVGGNVTIENTGAPTIELGGLVSVGGGVTIENTDANVVELGGLVSVGGDVSINDNPSAAVISLGALGSVGGSVSINDNPQVTTLGLGTVGTVGGDVGINDNDSAEVINLGTLGSVPGSVSVNDNDAAQTIDLGGLQEVDGDMSMDENDAAQTIDLGGLQEVDGDMSVNDNDAAQTVDLGGLQEVDGDMSVNDNDAAQTIDLGSLQSTGGEMTIVDNGDSTIDLGSLQSTGGAMTIVDNGDSTIELGSLQSTGGSLTVESTGAGTFSAGSPDVAGDTTLVATGYDTITAATANGATDVSILAGTASLHAVLPVGSFDAPVDFTIERQGDGPIEAGTDADGNPVQVDPLAGYRFTFAVPALNQQATLDFTVDLASPDDATRTALLDAVASGSASLAVKGDEVGATYEAFEVCTAGQTPAVDGCVEVVVLNSSGVPAATGEEPASVRFSGVAGHFSTWAVALVTPLGDGDGIAPVVTGIPDRAPNANGWYNAPVTIDWRSVDPDPSSGPPTDPPHTIATIEGAGVVYESAPSCDPAGNCATGTVTLSIDQTAPTVTCPTSKPTFTLGETGASITATVDDALSGPVLSLLTGHVTTHDVGAKTTWFLGTDRAGNETKASCSYRIVYVFDGFAAPLVNDAVNIVKVGQVVPLGFRLADAAGSPVTDLAKAAVSTDAVTCDPEASTNVVPDEALTPSALQSLDNGNYRLNWEATGVVGKCKILKVYLGEGIYRTATFQFVP